MFRGGKPEYMSGAAPYSVVVPSKIRARNIRERASRRGQRAIPSALRSDDRGSRSRFGDCGLATEHEGFQGCNEIDKNL
jgi:hypothetical protein